jgi:hypothetical protein
MRAFVLALSACAAFAVACQGTLIAPTDCGVIPEGGCVDKGGLVDQCGDRTCIALYECVGESPTATSGTWLHQRDCPARPAPDRDASVVDAAADASDAAPRGDASLPADLPPGATGGPGCVSLEIPDCALAVGYGCPNDCCGCEELFVCVNGGWDSWGTCVNDMPTSH